MPSCCVKWCINNSTDHHKEDGISFHVFPRNLIRKEIWIKAVRLERQEQDWCPTKRTQICSLHFKNHDIYMSNTGRQMITKTAVPICTMVFTDTDIECPYSENPLIKKENVSFEPIIIDIKPETISRSSYVTCPNCGCDFGVKSDPESFIAASETSNKTCSELANKSFSNIGSTSDTSVELTSAEIEFIFDDPKIYELKKSLKRKTVLAKQRLLEIKSLKSRNQRLMKTNHKLKDIVIDLKKKLSHS